MILIHTLLLTQVVPLGGGQLVASGSMWVAPAAETDPRAIRIQGDAVDLDTGTLAAQYLPAEVLEQLPPGTLSGLGKAAVNASLQGAHTAPEVGAG